MAQRSHTYAIRLAVEGGGQVATAGGKASGGLKGLGRQSAPASGRSE